MSAAKETEGNDNSLVHAFRDVLRVALPLMVSAGTFSLVLFADRTLLLWFDGASMSASMAGGNLFWVTACLPVGIVSMTGAIISQCIGTIISSILLIILVPASLREGLDLGVNQVPEASNVHRAVIGTPPKHPPSAIPPHATICSPELRRV